jgi:hypothetical protein
LSIILATTIITRRMFPSGRPLSKATPLRGWNRHHTDLGHRQHEHDGREYGR